MSEDPYRKKAKIHLILIAVAIAGGLLIYRFDYPQLFSGLRNIENRATNLVLEEAKKEFSAPQPLDLRPAASARKTAAAPSIKPPQPSVPTPAASSGLTRPGTIYWTNFERNLNGGLPPLAENATLDQIAVLRMRDMFAKQYFAHVAPDGGSAETVAQTVAYDYIALGENLALGGFSGDKDLVQAWMNSPGHRANILNTHYTQIGVAVGQGIFQGEESWIGVQIFGRPSSDCPSPDASLKVTIQSEESQLTAWDGELQAMQAEMNGMEPKYGPEYNQKVNEYNALVARYNGLLQTAKSDISSYNAEVAAFNACLNT